MYTIIHIQVTQIGQMLNDSKEKFPQSLMRIQRLPTYNILGEHHFCRVRELYICRCIGETHFLSVQRMCACGRGHGGMSDYVRYRILHCHSTATFVVKHRKRVYIGSLLEINSLCIHETMPIAAAWIL